MTHSLSEAVRNLLALSLLTAACSRDATRESARTDTAVVPAETHAATVAGQPDPYVGIHYDPLPPGTTYEGGAILTGPDGRPISFALTHVLTPRGNYFWLDSLLPDDGAHRSRIVRAALRVPSLARDEQMFVGSCDVNGKLDPAVVAIAVTERAVTRYAKIRQAWRAYPRSATFEVIPVAGIVCEEP